MATFECMFRRRERVKNEENEGAEKDKFVFQKEQQRKKRENRCWHFPVIKHSWKRRVRNASKLQYFASFWQRHEQLVDSITKHCKSHSPTEEYDCFRPRENPVTRSIQFSSQFFSPVDAARRQRVWLFIYLKGRLPATLSIWAFAFKQAVSQCKSPGSYGIVRRTSFWNRSEIVTTQHNARPFKKNFLSRVRTSSACYFFRKLLFTGDPVIIFAKEILANSRLDSVRNGHKRNDTKRTRRWGKHPDLIMRKIRLIDLHATLPLLPPTSANRSHHFGRLVGYSCNATVDVQCVSIFPLNPHFSVQGNLCYHCFSHIFCGGKRKKEAQRSNFPFPRYEWTVAHGIYLWMENNPILRILKLFKRSGCWRRRRKRKRSEGNTLCPNIKHLLDDRLESEDQDRRCTAAARDSQKEEESLHWAGTGREWARWSSFIIIIWNWQTMEELLAEFHWKSQIGWGRRS